MTDRPLISDDDLSLALDGEASPELQARIDASPEAQARLDALRAAAARVATPPPALADDQVDALISAALDAPVAPVAPRTRSQRRATPWLVAASVIVLMAIGLSLVWAGRSSDDDQASAKLNDLAAESADASGGGSNGADSSFTESGSSAEDQASAPVAGGHGAPTTVAGTTSSTADLPLLYLGSFPSADAFRNATASSLTDAWSASGGEVAYQGDSSDAGRSSGSASASAPSPDAVDRCGEQLQVTLSTKSAPIQTGYASVDGEQVLVYEFATASARDGKDTTLVAAVGPDACDEVVIFER